MPEPMPSADALSAVVREIQDHLRAGHTSPAMLRVCQSPSLRAVALWLAGQSYEEPGIPSAAALRETVMRDRWGEGVDCPTCDQPARVYRRSLYGTQVRALVRLAKRAEVTQNDWVHMTKYLKAWQDTSSQGGDPARLAFWGLLEKQPGEREDGSKRVGYYRVTDLGFAFVRGEVRVPEWLYFYSGHVVEHPGGEVAPHVTVREVMGDNFDYRMIASEALPLPVPDACAG